MKDKRWYKKSFRRNLVDMHIEEWDSKFLSDIDPEEYVALLKTARIQSAMVYANSHVGYCYWPTVTGHMHRGLKGRDLFGEIERLCHKEGIDFIAYYSLIFNNWAYDNDPSWRIKDIDGNYSRVNTTGFGFRGRYGLCCPNTHYRDFAASQVAELCENYDFEGVFFDMTFWPDVCFCDCCKDRFRKETGHEIPEVIDWNDPVWIEFQKSRENWIAEFALFMTQTVKERKPDVTVLHNTAPLAILPWTFASTEGVADACDYLGADFYQSTLHQSFICKLFYNITKNLPFEFYTSRCDPDLNEDHVTTKQIDQLKLNNYVSIAHNGAFLFIDAIDPVGTLNKEVYEMMGEVFGESQIYEEYIGGQMIADIAIYYDLHSKMDPEESGKTIRERSSKIPHLDAALGASKILKEAHIPFTVIGRQNLTDLTKYQIIILPNTLRIDGYEAEAIKKYVEDGGNLYASGITSPLLLSDVLGIDFIGRTKEKVTFVAPVEKEGFFLDEIINKYPLTINTSQPIVKALEHECILAKIVLPYTDPSDLSKFASIHSNPPGRLTDFPSLIYRKYGKGKVIWSAASIESINKVPHARVFKKLISELAEKPFAFKVDAPAAVEVTMFRQNDRQRYIINVINEQDQMPPIRIYEIKISVWISSDKINKLCRLSNGEELNFKENNGRTEFILPELNIFEMIAIECKNQ